MKTRAELLNMVLDFTAMQLVEILDNQQKLIDMHEKFKAKQDLFIKLQTLELEKTNALLAHYRRLD